MVNLSTKTSGHKEAASNQINHLFTHVTASELKARSNTYVQIKNEKNKMKNIIYRYMHKTYMDIYI